jgi:hypothetical protein
MSVRMHYPEVFDGSSVMDLIILMIGLKASVISNKDLIGRSGWPGVIHNFGCHADVMMMENSSSSLEHFPEKSYLCLLPKIIFLREVRRLLIYLPARMPDSCRLH